MAQHLLNAVCASTFMIRSTSNESYKGSQKSEIETRLALTVVVVSAMVPVLGCDTCLLCRLLAVVKARPKASK